MKFDSIDTFLNYGIFVIPEYQRGYSWGNEQLTDFVNDLSDVEYIKEHYVGTVTLIKSGSELIGISDKNKYDIVDGQQRITSIHIFLISLYYKIFEIDKAKADDEIIKQVIYKGKPLLRLNNKNDQEFFNYLLNENNINNLKQNKDRAATKSQKNLLNARLFFDNYFNKSSIKSIINVRRNLLSKFKLNVFELEEESEVGLIFETMNDRGLPLSDIDKIKNYLIYLSHKLNDKSLAKEINKKFGEIFTELMQIDNGGSVRIENQFLKDSYIIYKGETRNINDIHQRVKDMISQREVLKIGSLFDNNKPLMNKKLDEIEQFSKFLHRCSSNYAMLLNRNFENEEINCALLRLDILGKTETFLPLFLSILSHRGFKKDFLIPICEILEIFSLKIYVFGNRKSNTGNSVINDFAHRIFVNKLNFTDLKKELRLLVTKNSNTTEIRNSIINNNAYKVLSDNTVKLLLYDYETYLQKDLKFKYNIGSLNEFFANKKNFY